MKFTTKTEYGLLCMVHLAKHADNGPLSIKEMAVSEKYPVPYLEKILQALRHAGLVTANHGNRGGYSLAKKASEITLKEVIDALEGGTFEIFCAPRALT